MMTGTLVMIKMQKNVRRFSVFQLAVPVFYVNSPIPQHLTALIGNIFKVFREKALKTCCMLTGSDSNSQTQLAGKQTGVLSFLRAR